MLDEADIGRSAAALAEASKILAFYGLSYTVKNPAEALAITAVMMNPTLRGTALELAYALGRGMVRDTIASFAIINKNLVKPSAARAAGRVSLVMRHPAFLGGVFVMTAAGVSTAAQQGVNSNAIAMNPDLLPDLDSSSTDADYRREAIESAPLHWSPFGGMGFGTVF